MPALRQAGSGNGAEANRQQRPLSKLAPESPGVKIEATSGIRAERRYIPRRSPIQGPSARFPLDTQMQLLWLPTVGAQTGAQPQKRGQGGWNFFRPQSHWDLAFDPLTANGSCLYAPYVRGQAYLALGDGASAAAEFQKILGPYRYRGQLLDRSFGPSGRGSRERSEAKTLQGPQSDAARVQALAAYKDFLTLWERWPTPTSRSQRGQGRNTRSCSRSRCGASLTSGTLFQKRNPGSINAS